VLSAQTEPPSAPLASRGELRLGATPSQTSPSPPPLAPLEATPTVVAPPGRNPIALGSRRGHPSLASSVTLAGAAPPPVRPTKPNPSDPSTLPQPFPGQDRRRARRNRAARAGRPPRGHIAKGRFFLRASLQKGNSNSKVLWLFIVNCVENRRKSEKCKTNFVGFAVNYPTTLVILV
jgi:hypothetical protein